MKRIVEICLLQVCLVAAANFVSAQTVAAESGRGAVPLQKAELPAPSASALTSSASARAPDAAPREGELRASRGAAETGSSESGRAEWGIGALLDAVRTVSPAFADALEKSFFGIRAASIAGALLVLAAAWIVQFVVIAAIFGLVSKLFGAVGYSAVKSLLERLKRPMRAIILCAGLNAACLMFPLSGQIAALVGRAFGCAYYILLFWAAGLVSDFFFDRLLERASAHYKAASNLCDVGRRLVRALWILFGMLAVLNFFGVNISAVVASLGIGGAALAFASKDTIANFFGSVSLVADRPFALGDWIVAGDVEGTVESIGMRSTRIRTFARTLVTIPNFVLANRSVNNMSRMPMRREKFSFGVSYSATPEQMESLVRDVAAALRANGQIDSDSVRVNFSGFGDSSLDVAVTYYCLRVDGEGFAEVRQQANLDIMRAVYGLGLSFVVPVRSLHMEQSPGSAARDGGENFGVGEQDGE